MAEAPQTLDRGLRDVVLDQKGAVPGDLPAWRVDRRLGVLAVVGQPQAIRRLEGVGLAPLSPGVKNPLPWLAEMMDIKKEQNFFEGRVTEYQKASALEVAHDDEL